MFQGRSGQLRGMPELDRVEEVRKERSSWIYVMVAATQCTKAVYNKRISNTIAGTQYSGLLTPGQKASTEQLYDTTSNRRITMSIIIGA